MDETTRRLIERHTQKSGYFDTTELNASDLSRLAAEATGDLPLEICDVVVGIAYSGIFFGFAVAGGRQLAILQHDGILTGASVSGKKIMLADTAICDGKVLAKAKEIVEKNGGNVIGFAVIVDRQKTYGTFKGLPVWSAFQLEEGSNGSS